MKNISLQPIEQNDYAKISMLVSSDVQLQEELGFTKESAPTRSQVENDFRSWCESHSAKMFSIFKDDMFIGLITLSRIDIDNQSARLGYWLGSQFRSKGYGSIAFKKILDKINSMEINQVNGSVLESNIPSRSLWENNGGRVIDRKDDNLEYELNFPP